MGGACEVRRKVVAPLVLERDLDDEAKRQPCVACCAVARHDAVTSVMDVCLARACKVARGTLYFCKAQAPGGSRCVLYSPVSTASDATIIGHTVASTVGCCCGSKARRRLRRHDGFVRFYKSWELW
jgi:hypothetical protein